MFSLSAFHKSPLNKPNLARFNQSALESIFADPRYKVITFADSAMIPLTPERLDRFSIAHLGCSLHLESDSFIANSNKRLFWFKGCEPIQTDSTFNRQIRHLCSNNYRRKFGQNKEAALLSAGILLLLYIISFAYWYPVYESNDDMSLLQLFATGFYTGQPEPFLSVHQYPLRVSAGRPVRYFRKTELVHPLHSYSSVCFVLEYFVFFN